MCIDRTKQYSYRSKNTKGQMPIIRLPARSPHRSLHCFAFSIFIRLFVASFCSQTTITFQCVYTKCDRHTLTHTIFVPLTWRLHSSWFIESFIIRLLSLVSFILSHRIRIIWHRCIFLCKLSIHRNEVDGLESKCSWAMHVERSERREKKKAHDLIWRRIHRILI